MLKMASKIISGCTDVLSQQFVAQKRPSCAANAGMRLRELTAEVEAAKARDAAIAEAEAGTRKLRPLVICAVGCPACHCGGEICGASH